MWSRPVLCRLCECPESDGGVRVDQLDAEKLSEWWRRTIGAEFEPVQGEVICQFCLWDARQEHEYCVEKSTCGLSAECDWWSGHDNDKFFEKYYYQDEVIQAFKVELGLEARKVTNEQFSNSEPLVDGNNHTESVSKNLQKCLICALVLSNPGSFVAHMHKFHAGRFVQCKIDGICARVFLTKEEKKEHMLKDHKNVRKCEFCDRRYNTYHWHMSKFHKNHVRCSYHSCKMFFSSEEKMQKHLVEIHNVPSKKKCIFCGLFYSCMQKHFRNVHKSQLASAFKCTLCRSPKYFLTKEKFNMHNAFCHKNSLDCIYCNKKLIDVQALRQHVKNKHQGVKIMCTYHGCNKYFHTQITCDSHFEKFHKTENEMKIFHCPKCTFRATDRYILKQHADRKHGTKNIPCPKCEKYYCNVRALSKHLKTHEIELCQHCKKKIKNKSVKLHQRRTKCENCLQDLFCVQSARLHEKMCIKS